MDDSPLEPGLVLDASAVIAFMFRESGWEKVEGFLDNAEKAYISSVNASEVISDMLGRGWPLEEALQNFLGLNIISLDHTFEDGIQVAVLKKKLPRRSAISRADCACIALAERLALPVLTADSVWSTLELGGLEVRQIR